MLDNLAMYGIMVPMNRTALAKKRKSPRNYREALGYKYHFKCNNGKVIALNPELLLSKKITEEVFNKLKTTHIAKEMLIELLQSNDLSPETEKVLLGTLGGIEACEFKLQKLWGFEQNKAYHKFWELPHCTCPKLDNIDSYPYMQHYSKSCPLHKYEYEKSIQGVIE